MKLNIDLGEKMGGPETMKMDPEEKHYPTLRIVTNEQVDFPKGGTAVIQFEKASSSQSKRNGKQTYECVLDVKKLVSIKGESKSGDDDTPTKKYDEAGDALDKLARAKSKENEKNEDDEGMGY